MADEEEARGETANQQKDGYQEELEREHLLPV